MSRDELEAEFVETVLPRIYPYETKHIDVTMRREAWNDWIDDLHESGVISSEEYDADTGLPDYLEG